MRWLVAILLMASTVNAAEVPQSSRRDNRIQYVDYHPGSVVEVAAAVGVVTRIVFEKGEVIEDLERDVQVGKPMAWHFASTGNILSMKPISVNGIQPNAREWPTNVGIVTSKGRLYDLDVRVASEDELTRIAYRVQFEYPKEDFERRLAKHKADTEKERKQQQCMAGESDAPPIVPRNSHYGKVGKSSSIAPNMAFDDGTFTYLRFSAGQDIPVPTIVGADGIERAVNKHSGSWIEKRYSDGRSRLQVSQDGCLPVDTLVVHRVAPAIMLRAGSRVVKIINLEKNQ